MRIVCQKCAAAYAIDDRLISPKGVRAQCPRCRHLQLVKRDAAAPAEASSPAPQSAPPGAAPRPMPTPSSSSVSAADLFNDLDAVPGDASAQPDPLFDGIDVAAPSAPRAAPAAAARPGPPVPSQAADPLLDFLGPPPEAPPPPVAPAPRRPAGAAAAPGAPATAAPGARPQSTPAATVGCRECNKPLTDPFDQAIGTCEDCRQKVERASQAATAVTGVTGSKPAGTVDFDLPPLESIDMSGVSSAPGLTPEPRSGARAAVGAPALSAEPRSGVRSSPPRPYVPQQMAPMNAARSGGGRGALVGVFLALLLLGGGGAAYYYFVVLKPQRPDPALAAQPPPQPPIPAAIQAVLPRWELQYVDLSGSSMARLEEGALHLSRDQRSAYSEAEEAFQQALLLDPRSDAAIAGYVQALALGRGTSIDKGTFDEARSLIEASEERAGRTPLLLLAHANLLLCRPNQPEAVEQARQLAEEALKSGTDMEKAEAHLVLGRAFLQTSMGLANQHFDSAQALAPNLQRVHYHRALAHEAAGSYSLAIEALKGRLEKDPEHWDSLATMARIYLEVGEVEQARKLYESRAKGQSGDVRALVPLAVLRYQVDGNAGAAIRELRALLKNRSRYMDRDVAEMLVHLATAERMAGSVDAGVKAAEEALGVVKDLPAAHLQLFLAAIGRGDVAKAAKHLTGFQGKLEDPALDKLLAGRLRLAEKKPAEALEFFQEAVRLDSRREDALLLAGIAAAGAGRRDDAFRLFFQALQSDPMRLTPRPVMTLEFLRPGETLAGMEGSILALASGSVEVAAPLYEGVLLYHMGDRSGAERLFQQALDLDPNNSGAAAYLSLLALQRGDGAKARSLGARAVAAGRQQPIAHLANGLALAEGKQLEPAKRSLRDALALAPSLLSAEVKLAELEMSTNRDSARDRLVKVAGLDGSYLAAKRLLFTTDKRG
ncbi:tetratricopeptide repeat protein [Hyalangium rubrum]|uniref:Tetratricopeptide repeat protein n=1 Tax=Hyalangium rubrum TaxID=3103134 RepID=A0ABU5GVE0_9BACT|nr:tetratricopeptide repeat protein [Hyalangium sp. s54d21]MDY7224872.1 tetratricopeptide repeat protein [Hyalangium sp. s54d21]